MGGVGSNCIVIQYLYKIQLLFAIVADWGTPTPKYELTVPYEEYYLLHYLLVLPSKTI